VAYSTLVLIAFWTSGLIDDDLPSLINQLGSPRFSAREIAQKSLLELGPQIIPALKSAREHEDQEVKARAATILHEMETRQILEPVRVPRWTHPISLGAVVEALGDTGGRRIRFDQVKGLEHAQIAPLPADQDPTYWNMVRHMEQSCGVRAVSVMEGEDEESAVSACLTLVPARKQAKFIRDQGPFRLKLLSADIHKSQNFDPDLGDLNEPEAMRSFHLQLQVMGEPRLVLFSTARVQVQQANDELGQSLIKREQANGVEADLPLFISPAILLDGGSGPCLTTSVELALPDRPGRLVKKLQGSIPLTVLQRRSEPVQVALIDGPGKSYENSSFRFSIKSVELAPQDAQPSLEIELSTQDNVDSVMANLIHGQGMNLSQLLEHLCEVVDSQGKPLTVVPMETDDDGGKVRIRLAILPSDPSRKPVGLRVYDAIVATQEISFEFHDVHLP